MDTAIPTSYLHACRFCARWQTVAWPKLSGATSDSTVRSQGWRGWPDLRFPSLGKVATLDLRARLWSVDGSARVETTYSLVGNYHWLLWPLQRRNSASWQLQLGNWRILLEQNLTIHKYFSSQLTHLDYGQDNPVLSLTVLPSSSLNHLEKGNYKKNKLANCN